MISISFPSFYFRWCEGLGHPEDFRLLSILLPTLSLSLLFILLFLFNTCLVHICLTKILTVCTPASQHPPRTIRTEMNQLNILTRLRAPCERGNETADLVACQPEDSPGGHAPPPGLYTAIPASQHPSCPSPRPVHLHPCQLTPQLLLPQACTPPTLPASTPAPPLGPG